MSSKGLFDPECAGPNPLSRLTDQLTTSSSSRHENVESFLSPTQITEQIVSSSIQAHNLTAALTENAQERAFYQAQAGDWVSDYKNSSLPAIQGSKSLSSPINKAQLRQSSIIVPPPTISQTHFRAMPGLAPGVDSPQQAKLLEDQLFAKQSDGDVPMETAFNEAYWKNLAEKFSEMTQEWEDTESNHLESDYKVKEYKFTEANCFANDVNAFEKGLTALEGGDIPTAVLLFEAAVSQNSNHHQAWYHLGCSQQLNENDVAALSALTKTCSLTQPSDSLHQDALLKSSISFANEGLGTKACESIIELFARINPTITFSNQPQTNSKYLSTDHDLCHAVIEHLTTHFLPSSDPSVKRLCVNSLGILNHVINNHATAAVFFTNALDLCSQDISERAQLWNRIGACLANDGKPVDAVHAYSNALQLTPGSIRTRYNLGVACSNMGAKDEACKQFLTALRKQTDSQARYAKALSEGDNSSAFPTDVSPRKLTSQSVWSALRMNLLALERPNANDLYEACLAQNLDAVEKGLVS